MNSYRAGVLLTTLLIFSAAGTASARPAKQRQRGAVADAAAPVSGFRAELLKEIADAREKILALAEATPQEKLSWRPAEGVRTFGEVYMHIAAGNFFVLSYTGFKPPADVGDVRQMEKIADKAKVIEMLRRSFEHLQRAVLETPDRELDKPAATKLLGEKSTMRSVLLRLGIHAHEHMGQAVAYARMNGIAPPWSAAR